MKVRNIIRMLVMLTAAVLLSVMGIHASDPTFCFTLLADGEAEQTVSTGDTVTVTFTLERTDSTDPYSVFAMQNEIRYDSTVLELIEDSVILKEGISSNDIRISNHEREFYMNYLSFTGGVDWDAVTVVGSFQMRVIGTGGTTVIENRDCAVSRPDGSGSYAYTASDVTLVIAAPCEILFDSCGGSPIPAQNVICGSKASTPPMPQRDGYIFSGWYRDALCTDRWSFSEPVTEDLTLYAGWERDTEAVPFTDVPSDTWYSDSIRYVSQNGLMVGIGDAAFAPDTPTSRAMTVTILWRMEGSPTVGTPILFEDVGADQWYTEAVRWAVDAGIANGYSSTVFGPDDTVTREQMAAFLYRYAAFKGCDVTADTDLSEFADADSVSDWAITSMQWAVDSGMILGVGNNTLLPLGNATRAQTAAILTRFCIWK